jgi:hypothetical protein
MELSLFIMDPRYLNCFTCSRCVVHSTGAKFRVTVGCEASRTHGQECRNTK